MTTGGWIVMLLSVGFVTGLFAWCIGKVLATPGAETHMHTQSDIVPPDQEA